MYNGVAMDVELQSFVGLSPSMSNDKEELRICYCLFIQSFMTIVLQSRTEPNQFTVHELVYILFKQIEYRRNCVGLALCISFIMCTFWLSVRFRMYEWLFEPCS